MGYTLVAGDACPLRIAPDTYDWVGLPEPCEAIEFRDNYWFPAGGIADATD